jgi:hypothetical protein
MMKSEMIYSNFTNPTFVPFRTTFTILLIPFLDTYLPTERAVTRYPRQGNPKQDVHKARVEGEVGFSEPVTTTEKERLHRGYDRQGWTGETSLWRIRGERTRKVSRWVGCNCWPQTPTLPWLRNQFVRAVIARNREVRASDNDWRPQENRGRCWYVWKLVRRCKKVFCYLFNVLFAI